MTIFPSLLIKQTEMWRLIATIVGQGVEYIALSIYEKDIAEVNEVKLLSSPGGYSFFTFFYQLKSSRRISWEEEEVEERNIFLGFWVSKGKLPSFSG